MAAPRRPALSIAAIAVYCACVFLSCLFLPDSESVRPWKGVRLLASSLPGDAVLAGLASIGIKDVIHEGGQILAFSAFDEWGSVTLPGLDARLAPGDPRRDEFLDNAIRYFRARSGEEALRLYYLMDATASSSILSGRLKSVLGSDGGWTLVERSDRKGWTEGAAAWLLIVLALLITGRRKALPALPSLLGWIGIFLSSSWPFIISCLPALACAFMAVCAFSRYPYERPHAIGSFLGITKEELGWGVILPLAIGSLAALLILPASYAFAIAASSLGALLPMRFRLGPKRGSHEPFRPLRMRMVSHGSFLKQEMRSLPVVLALIASALSLLAYASAPTRKVGNERKNLLSFPHPRGYTEAIPVNAELPGFAEYLTHVAFQAGFLESDLVGAGRAFRDFSRKGDGSLEEGDGKAERLGIGSNPEGRGIERVLRIAGQRSRIAELPWDDGGTASPGGAWAIPIVLSSILIACAAFVFGKRIGRDAGRTAGRHPRVEE